MSTSPAMGAVPERTAAAPVDDWPSPAYAWYVVMVLVVAALLSYIDRFILGVLIEPIRHDLNITDTQVSLVAGSAFALFYGFMALPLGRLADYKNRVHIIALGVFCWSVMTATCGLAQTYWQLLLARMGVGVAEASLSSSAFSLIADHFPPSRLPVAMSVYIAAVMLGSGVGLLAGGSVFELTMRMGAMHVAGVGLLQPWQISLIAVGLPGVLVSLLVLSIREPLRRNRSTAADRPLPIREVVRFVRERARFLGFHHAGFSIMAAYTYAVFIWSTTLISRTYGWSVADAGMAFGIVVLLTGVTGLYCGGLLGQILTRRGVNDAILRVSVYSMAVLAPVSIVAPLMPTPFVGLCALGVTIFIFSVAMAGAPVALQLIAPNELRGQLGALFSFTSVVVGLGAGPSAVALLTDHVFGDPAAIRYSMAIVGGVTAAGGGILVAASLRPYRDLIRRLPQS